MSWVKKIAIGFIALVVLLGLALLFIPVFDGPNSHRIANEAIAVGRLRRVRDLQGDYVGSHPSKGFACQLSTLKSIPKAASEYDSDEFLMTAERTGYRLTIGNCEADTDGLVRRYQISATAIVPGKSGVRAFCMDQSGVIWFDANGSAENCLAARRAIS